MISHSHKVLFVHVPKCAGQSIEMMFLRDLGLTWNTRGSLLLRQKLPDELGPERLAHLFAYEYEKFGYIEPSKFSQYFKFALIRDPIDRILSELNYRHIKKKGMSSSLGVSSVEEYITKLDKTFDKFSDHFRHIEPQVKYVFNEDRTQIIVDKIINFATIDVSIDFISEKILKNNQIKIGRKNVSEKKIWTKHSLSNEDINFLTDYYKDDFNLLDQISLKKDF